MQLRGTTTLKSPFQSGDLPSVLQEVIDLVHDPKTSVARLVAAVSKDRTLVSSVLKKANSPLYGFRHRIEDVGLAVTLLGFDMLKETVRRFVMVHAFRKMTDILFHYDEFWNHAIGCGITARMLAHRYALCNPDDAFVSGLLHDAGFVVLHYYYQDNVVGWLVHGIDDASTVGMKLESALGISHSEIARWVTDRWGMPGHIVEAIRYHHTPGLATRNPRLTATVHLADVLCNRGRSASLKYDSNTEFSAQALRIVGLNEATLLRDWSTQISIDATRESAAAPSFDDLVQSIKQGLLAALEGLQEKEKLLLALHYYERLSFSQLGHVLAMTESEAEATHAQALMKLQTILPSKGLDRYQ
jgi:HD-like signal output (HDOD) protein